MKVKIAQLQLPVYADRERNLRQAEEAVAGLTGGSGERAADIVALGEMFDCPYDSTLFPAYAQPDGGAVFGRLSALAARHHIWLQAGSVPEADEEGRGYNTAYVFDREGNLQAKHRKVHLFDIDVAGGQSFRESRTLSAGDRATVFDTEFGRMGLCICFDIRFPELARRMVLDGARVIFVPAAFNMTTGPAHWTLNFRSRALDNQCFYVGTSSSRDETASYRAYGHSIVTSPWGDVVSELDEKPGTAVTEIDLDQADAVRRQLPLLSARRPEAY